MLKQCIDCGEMKDLEKDYYKKVKSYCKECAKIRAKKWQEKNKERYKEISSKAHKEYYKKNKEKLLEHQKEYYNNNQEKIQQYREANREKAKNATKEWRKKYPEKLAAIDANRRAMKKALPHTNSCDEWLEVLQIYDNKCAITGKDNPSLEHFIPLNWGHGGSLRNNIYPLDTSLNVNKSAKNPFKWAKSLSGKQQEEFRKVVHILANENGLTYKEFKKYVNWCEKNKRSVEKVIEDNEKGITSIDLWKEATK